MKSTLLTAIIGGHSCSAEVEQIAKELGKLLAKMGAIVITGGLNGVMEAVSKGAKRAGGLTVGILPSGDKGAANPYVDVPIATGLGQARNTVVASCADIVIAFPGEYGTLSEIAFALNLGKPVLGIGSWDIEGVIPAKSAAEAAQKVKQILGLENNR
ncbi:MAG: TIGR00725 family protein [Candidatus Omnitrophota bacterium]